MHAVREQHPPECARVDQPLQLLVFVIEAAHEAHLDQRAAEFRLPPHDFQRGGNIGGERLLAHHRLAVLEAGQQLLVVGRARRGQQHRVYVGIGDGVERVGDRPAARDPGRDLLGLLGEVVVDDGDGGALGAPGDALDVVGPHHPDTERRRFEDRTWFAVS